MIPEMAERLKATGDAELIEGNYWGDVFWGTCDGVGENWLGRLLMAQRDVLNTPVTPLPEGISRIYDEVAQQILSGAPTPVGFGTSPVGYARSVSLTYGAVDNMKVGNENSD